MFHRIFLIASRDYLTLLRRPMVWVWLLLLALLVWGLTLGNLKINTGGDSMIGAARQQLSSEFEMSRMMAAFTLLVHGFFASVLFGMAVIRDLDIGILPLLNSTRLKLSEYLTGKFLGCLLLVLTVLAINVLLNLFLMYVVPPATRAEYFGPLQLRNFLNPVFKFVLPALIMLGGLSFALGTISRKPILVFAFPLIFLLAFGLFLNNWSPLWLPNWTNDLLCLIDPYGTRWLNETWFNVDRGAVFYNTQPVILGGPFLLSRIVVAVFGLLCFMVTIPLFGRQQRGARHGALSAVNAAIPTASTSSTGALAAAGGLAGLQMKQRGGGWIRETWNVMRYELRELRYSPGLYLFVPVIIIQVVATAAFREGAFGTPLLHTSGSLAEGAMQSLAVLGCMLMLFFTVESQLRERIKRLAPVYYATQTRSVSILLGKSLANTGVCVAIMGAALFACLIILLVQNIVRFEALPFVAYWLLLLMPTYVLWGALITLVVVLTRSRYTTYGIAAAVLLGTLYLGLSGKMTWFTNWMLIGAAPWSDISHMEMDRSALVINRLFALSLAVLFTFLAARFFWRRELDAVQLAGRFRPRAMGRPLLRGLPFIVPPVILGAVLWSLVNHGYQGKIVEARQKKYWQQNVSTWTGTTPPSVSGVDVRLDLKPADQTMRVTGILRLTNDQFTPLGRFALSAGTHWKNVKWRLGKVFPANGELPDIPTSDSLVDYEPDNRSGLYVFKFEPAVQPGESVTLSWSFDGRFPEGISKNGGNNMEFILPSGVVLTSFGTAFVPYPGFAENVGLDPKSQPEAKVYEDNFFEKPLKPLFGGGDRFHVRTTISGPEDFTFNAVGTKRSDDSANGRRTVVWQSDSPVSFFNVVGGRDWLIRKGDSTEVYYNSKHPYTVDEISETIDAARAWYSRWFAPYPWEDLRLSEFPNMATYAQGFPTNITFSEGIGFLTRDKPGADAPFMVTAHETAHQWWGNILVPGKGPGGNILSEGMAHFSTGLLFDQIKGERARIEFFKLIEDQYGEKRRVDNEQPLVKTDGSRDGDTTVIYDKGGWVFWMLLNHMGRTENLQGIQSFIRKYSQTNDDYPVLQDFVAHLRDFARDKEAYDEFTRQWFHEVIMPQYEFSDVQMQPHNDQWRVTGTIRNIGTGKMPLQICAALGDRYVGNEPNPDYRDSRTEARIGSGESAQFAIDCPFKPDRVLVDPDALVLQLQRKQAVHPF